MKLYLPALVLLCVVAGCGDPGAQRYSGSAPPAETAFGVCTFCHVAEANALLPVAHVLACTNCHADARPGFAGPKHRANPSPQLVPSFPSTGHLLQQEAYFGACAYCHNATSHQLLRAAPQLKCEVCHSGELVPVFGPGHRSHPDRHTVPSAPTQPHTLDVDPKWGSCALCHNDVAKQLEGAGAAATELVCETCHDERSPDRYGPNHFSRPDASRVPAPAAAPHAPGTESRWGACSFCHISEARALESVVGSGGELRCESCHAEQRPGVFGPGHRSRPPHSLVPNPPENPHQPSVGAAASGSCAYCHARLAENVATITSELGCTGCHRATTSGDYFGRGHQSLPNQALVPAFVGRDHAAGVLAPFGSCAYCHRDLAESLYASSGESLGCVLCHSESRGGFGPEHRSLPGLTLVPSFVGPSHNSGNLAAFGTCAVCHRSSAERVASYGHATLPVACEGCHADLDVFNFGRGHRGIVRCSECHGQARQTHADPGAGTIYECANCHEPHGSTNAFLIRERLTTSSGNVAVVWFNNLHGVADGSFASVSEPGTGLCEVCHTTTRFFRSDGGGAPHFPFPCFTCHPHVLGFSVRP